VAIAGALIWWHEVRSGQGLLRCPHVRSTV
jgi:hypothetical protein